MTTLERSDEGTRWTIDSKAIRFYHKNGSQVNAQWWLLNPFLKPRDAAMRRIRNFFHAIKAGIRIMETGK